MRDDKYFKVDLHVHTFASNDYKGKKSEEEYLNILNSGIENDVDLICIADHFSVKGFKGLIDKKNSLTFLLQQLRERNDADLKYLNKIEEELNLFSKIHILMGIEIKINPGIHYVVVFEENITPQEVENFLLKITNGEIEDKFGSSDFMLQITQVEFINLIKNTFKNNCFIYAPHADSDSGVIESLRDFGSLRLQIINNDNLSCIGFNKEKTKDYVIKNLLKERKQPLNFIQDSDYHGGQARKSDLFIF